MTAFDNVTLRERVYHKLLDLIIEGELPLGSQIDERNLAERLTISRTPIREAINTLVQDGLVEYRPYRGNFIRQFTVKDVREVYEVRSALESLAIRLAVQQLTQTGLTELEGILNNISDAAEVQDIERISASDRAFHKTIARLSGNKTLIDGLERLDLQVRLMRQFANQNPETVTRTLLERPSILAALRARNAELASQLLEAHIDGVRRSILTRLEEVSDTETSEDNS